VRPVVNTKKNLILQGIHISVMHMKLRVILIIGLLAACLIAPATAYRDYPMDVTYSEDDVGTQRAVAVHFQDVSEYDQSDKFSPYKYPPEKYKFILLNYSLINPTDRDVTYEFNVSIRDQAGRIFYTDQFILGETVPAHSSLQNRQKDFAVYRNSTNLQIVWTDKKLTPPWGHYDTVIDINLQDVTPTPSSTPTPVPTATPTPTPAPAQGCLSFLPLGLIIGSIGCVGVLTKKYRSGR
jgi:hypothetical protein